MKPTEFLRELATLTATLRRDIEARALALDPSPEARAERRRRVLRDGDFLFFAYTYFPHHIRGAPSLFQAHFCRRFPALLRQARGVREWWIAPRGEAKSSLATKIGPVWVAVQALLSREAVRAEVGVTEAPPLIDYVLLLGAETRLPTKLLAVVRTEIEHNAALSLDFPEVGPGPNWKVGEIVTSTGVKIEPFGAEQAVRGTFHGASRPGLLLGDDLITDREAKSPTERDNRWTWLEKAIDYLGPPDGSVKYVGVGTVLDHDDPISRAKRTIGHVVHHFRALVALPTHMDLWAECERLMRDRDPDVERSAAGRGEVVALEALPSHQYYVRHRKRMDAGAVTSWPSVRSLYDLMRARAKSPRAFATEMQGDGDNADQVFTRWGHSTGDAMAHWVWYAACDPSMGSGDPSAICVGAWDPADKVLHVREATRKRRAPSKLQADLISVQRRYAPGAVAFENNNAYEAMRQMMMSAALGAGVALPLIGITATVSPEVRIEELEPYITDLSPRILIHPSCELLADEMRTWPARQQEHHYDLLTALHLLWHIASTRGAGLAQVSTRRAREAAVDMRGY